VKTIHNIHSAVLAAAASAIMITGTAGIASADSATNAPSTGATTQQPTGTTVAPAINEAAPAVQPTKAKKKERIRRAERGTKNAHPK
jgi:hypothetical protein